MIKKQTDDIVENFQQSDEELIKEMNQFMIDLKKTVDSMKEHNKQVNYNNANS